MTAKQILEQYRNDSMYPNMSRIIFEESDCVLAMKEYAHAHCYQLLTEWIACKYGYGNPEGVKFRDEWLIKNII